jgi:hypothetical protein
MSKYQIYLAALAAFLVIPTSFLYWASHRHFAKDNARYLVLGTFQFSLVGFWIGGAWVAREIVIKSDSPPNFGHAFGEFFQYYMPFGFVAFVALGIIGYRVLVRRS